MATILLYPPRRGRAALAMPALFLAMLFLGAPARGEQLCRIDIVDEESGWPVPLVQLSTTHNVRFTSDNAGVIAFDLPELMGQETWFTVEGHGYEVPADGFGMRGVRLTPTPGGRLTVKVRRKLPAKRLGRITGAGLFGESQRLGLESDWRDQGILGCDSVQTAVHKGRLFWGWGDTTLARYPLGLFHMIGATTDLQPLEQFEPPVRLRYSYVTDAEGRPREVAKMPGEGPTWLTGYASVPDASGEEHLVATYLKIDPPLAVYEAGLCVWDDDQQQFVRHRVLWSKSDDGAAKPPTPEGHPVRWTDEEGERWLLFGDPFPAMKIPDSFEAWSDPDQWQVPRPQTEVPTADGSESIEPHRGSIAWNEYRGKWGAIFTQMRGNPSLLGEIWYAEADSPLGPWSGAIKVVTHANYTFYNPRLHPEFTPPDSPILLFEGTYTNQFSGTETPTPRHDYNQILYRLDLDEIDGVR